MNKVKRLSTRDCESKMKMEQNTCNGLAFAVVFLQAKHAGAAMLT